MLYSTDVLQMLYSADALHDRCSTVQILSIPNALQNMWSTVLVPYTTDAYSTQTQQYIILHNTDGLLDKYSAVKTLQNKNALQ
jgi:hypothetical protein